MGLSLVAAPLTLVVSPAQAADPVTITLLNINDFHGRIDANTTKFATTVEQLRAAGGEDSTLLLSAGDNIGASLFASSNQADQPTIDVLNALDLATSAVGNHEFDRGFADLTGRVADAADWDYLGANVYEKGTTTPALQEYELIEVSGVTVGVIGTVTEETPTLVTPTGVQTLSFGDPVVATNRVAAQLSDGNDANGEADVIVAEFHEGAGAGIPEGSTLDQEIAAGGAFADIVTKTSAEVDAIFTGHTHKQYAWEAPVPGAAGATRPVLQTGSYGENIGKITLTVDPDTGDVSAHTQENVARAAAEDLTLPRVAAVKAIADAAIADAKVVGNQPIGAITGDITTAFAGGAYVDGKYTGGTRDNRAAESTLGGLVANALRDGIDFADVDLAVTNSGGLRAELFYAGDTASNPANADGVVTFAEANGVLPFNNTVALVELTGAQIEEVFEQQWQLTKDGEVPSRPYAQLGMSDNVRVTADPSKPRGERITSIWLDDEPIDPAATYTLSTLSFLAAGGDNFHAFKDTKVTDTGLLDGDMWRDYLKDSSPISPDFARQQVEASALPSSVRPGETVTFSLSQLDLTSLGSPANTTVEVFAVTGEDRVPVAKDIDVVDGAADVTFSVPSTLTPSSVIEVVAQPSGTTVSLAVGKASSSLQVKRSPKKVFANKTRPTIKVMVSAEGEKVTTGKVKVRTGGNTYTRRVENGVVTLKVGPYAKRGMKRVAVRYLGTASIDSSRKIIKLFVRR